jgi:hypothetical protein
MMLWVWWLFSFAFAEPLSWTVETSTENATIEIEFLYQNEVFLRLYSSDNHPSRSLYNVADQDSQNNIIVGQIDQFWLASGGCSLRIYEGVTLLEERELTLSSSGPKVVMASTPLSGTGIVSLKTTEGRLTGVSFSEVINGASFLIVDQEAEWRAILIGAGKSSPETITGTTVQWAEHIPNQISQRKQSPKYDWFIRLMLFPVSCFMLFIMAWTLLKVLRKRENLIAFVLCSFLGLWVIRSVLGGIGESLLMGEVSYNDPPTSATLLYAIQDSLWNLSEISKTFNFPEGHSWLILGPNWLAYFLLSPLVFLFGPVVLQNLGIAIACTLNAFCAWLLARDLGIGKWVASVAAIGVVCSPVFLNEVDKLSLDRAFIFPILVFFLCLRRSFTTENPRIWILGAGSSIAITFYFQVYYGLYLVALLPFLFLIRIFSINRENCLRFLMITALGLFLIAPGLFLLKDTTSGTLYDAQNSLWASESLLQPLEVSHVQEYLRNYDPRSGDGSMHKDMSSPENRLLAVISNALPLEQILFPTKLFMGGALYWIFAPFALWLASEHRKKLFQVYGDIILLSVMSLGPFLKLEEVFYQVALPYYVPHLFIPSFDQLKHPDRFAIMAASISSIPLAFFLQHLLARVRRYRRLLSPILCLFFGWLWLFVQPVPSKASSGIAWIYIKLERALGIKVNNLAVQPLYQPKAWRFPKNAGLEKIAGSSVFFLPMLSALPVEVYMNALQEGIQSVNNPPHGVDPQRQLSNWAEDNVLLNRAVWLSGSPSLRNVIMGSVSDRDFEDIRKNGLEYFVMYREYFLSERRWLDTDEFLAEHCQLVHRDNNVIIWKIGKGTTE